jgi:hypothetical protein
MKEPKTENVESTDAGTPPVPESPEVVAARSAAARRQKRDELDEAAKILGTDVRNSIDQVAHYSINENPAILREQLARLYERLGRAHAILAKHIDNLPTFTTPTAPTT